MKKQKVIITGCLGYLGTRLCELYSGEARYKDIICIDNRFISERVSQLRSWGMHFYQVSILDKDKLSELLQNADICYHLAGITDVSYVSSDIDEKKDQLIREVGVEGTLNVLRSINRRQCKLIFPSTHVIFEGLQGTTFDIEEDDPNAPRLTYSRGKLISESDIQQHHWDNHIIVRLGSVYGYSGDTMRINIMPNLFSKIASQDGTISLFSGGVQWKSMVHVVDAVRAMKFLAESNHTGTYHLSNENMTIRQVADICKEVNPKVTIVSTDDEVPNLGYTLSNRKLLDTGFKFLYNIEDAIRNMITRWSYKEQPTELEYIQRGGNNFIDQRGIIRNYELTEPINLIGYIESRVGTVRANHYHPIQEQKCLLISGRYISVTKDLSYDNASLEYRVIRPGDIAIIRPNVAHTMVFLQDSVLLNLVRGEREHSNYGITHTIPYELVNESMRDDIMNTYMTKCRVCGCTELQGTVNLGMSPLANNLLNSRDQQYDIYPLELDYCPQCYNVQLSVCVPPEQLFSTYLYVSSTSATFRKHFEDATDSYITRFNLTDKSLVLDIGSNDGVFLKPLQDKGIRVCGVEPASNIAKIANEKGIPTIHGFFNRDTANEVYRMYGSPDIITASNVFAHADDIYGITEAAFSILKEDGVFIIEVQYLMDTIRDLTFDNIYHEHVNYWSVHALNYFFTLHGLLLFYVEHIDTHGGSIRCYISRKLQSTNVQQWLDKELKQGINSVSTLRTFGDRISAVRDTVRINMKLLKEKFPDKLPYPLATYKVPFIAAFGSPAKATTALNYYGIDSSIIRWTMDDNELKQGKFIPGTGIEILPNVSALDLVIVLAWNFFDSIVERCKLQGNQNAQFISIKDLEIPDMPILDTTTLVGTKSTGKVYDCFLFFNELDLLELRLNVLDSIVDYFVICESNITHSGGYRDFCFEQYRERFAKWSHKIIYIQVDDMPADFTDLGKRYNIEIEQIGLSYFGRCENKAVSDILHTTIVDLANPVHCREYWQRECILRGLENVTDSDIIMLSDVDEIPNPDTLQYILDNFDSTRVYAMRQNSYYYSLNLLKEKHWVGPRIASYSTFMQHAVGDFRHIRDIIVGNGGWHFSFQGNPNQVITKMLAYSHCDMLTDDVQNSIESRMSNLQDPYGRSGNLKRVEIDSTYPKYLLDSIDNYRHMIS